MKYTPLANVQCVKKAKKMAYESKIKELVGKYHTPQNCLGYYLADLSKIAEKQQIGEEVINLTLTLIQYYSKHENPELKHLAGAYALATMQKNERRTQTSIAKNFGISTKELSGGIRDLMMYRHIAPP